MRSVEEAIFFSSATDFYDFLSTHSDELNELWVGIYKSNTGRAAYNQAELVDMAMCFGWIDGLIKRIDDDSFGVRFTPRKPKSVWSSGNIERAEALIEMGMMQASGLAAFQRRILEAPEKNRALQHPLSDELQEIFDSNVTAKARFENMPPAYQRHAQRWVMQAKREETRHKRLYILIDSSLKGVKIPAMSLPSKDK